MFPPQTKILESLLVQLYEYIVHYSKLYQGSTVFERAENGNAVLCNYIDFDLIFQKNCTVQILQYIDCGPGRAGNFGPVDTSIIHQLSLRIIYIIYTIHYTSTVGPDSREYKINYIFSQLSIHANTESENSETKNQYGYSQNKQLKKTE